MGNYIDDGGNKNMSIILNKSNPPFLKYLTKSSPTGHLYHVIYDIKSHGWFPYV